MPAQPTEGESAANGSQAIEIRAVVLREPGRPVRVEPVWLSPPRGGEVLVRVAAAGVCRSDLHLADGLLGDGRWPMVLGHEGAGVVEAVGDGVVGIAPGDRVAFCFVPACGQCASCRAGRPTLCEPASRNGAGGMLMDGTSRLCGTDGTVLQHGLMVACFAQYAVVPAAGAVPLPPTVPLWQAALLSCGVVTGIGAVKRAGVAAGDSVCVIGCGGVGLQVIAGARLADAGTIIAVDRDPEKLERARRLGATHVVDARTNDVVARVLTLAPQGMQRAFEVVGLSTTIRQAWDVLAPGGTAVVVGVAPPGVEVSIPAIELLSEKTLTGSYYGSSDVAEAIAAAAELLLAGRLGIDDVISHFIPLDEVEAAFERLRQGQGARSVVVVDEQLAGHSL